jgi:hypothetical protein
MSDSKYLNAIVYVKKESPKKSHFLKYHHIPKNEKKKGEFLSFTVKKLSSLQPEYVNFYDAETRDFIERIYLL